MTSRKKHPHADYQGDPLSRRDLLKRILALGGIGAAGTYLAYAPEDYPWSLRDSSGLRGMPVEIPFQLPDFRVEPANPGIQVGVGRGGDARTMLLKALDAIGGLRHFIQPGDVVLVKPNVAFDRSPNLGATTNPAIIETLVRLLLVDARAAEVRIADNPIESPADCFAKSGIGAAAEQAGGRVYLPDPNAFELLYTPGAKLIEEWAFFKRPFKDVNKVIGIAPAKDHNLCHASLGIKNWYGLLGGRRNQFHQDIHEIVSDLSIMIRPTLTIVDGTRVLMENGPTGGDPSNVRDGNAILAGIDPVATDAWAFEHLLQRPGRLPDYLYMAEQKGSGKVNYKDRIKVIT
ncbi:MAG: DUF362 domain-containing protein [Sedimenticolaceae bacterium]